MSQPAPPAEKPVRCPACKAVQVDLVCRGGRLFAVGNRLIEITGFICQKCNKAKHWASQKTG
jgi:hypothetical protein